MRAILVCWSLIGFLCWSGHSIQAQQVGLVEYYWNVIPANGQGTTLNVVAADSIEQVFTLAASTLSPGQHILYLRVVDTNGAPSHYKSFPLWVDTTGQPTPVTAWEWFVDTDPGVAQGQVGPVSATDTLQINPGLTTDTLTGNHRIYTRVKSSNGSWSHYLSGLLHMDDYFPSQVRGWEWFVNSDPGLGLGQAFTVGTTDSLSIRPALSTDTLSSGPLTYYVRAQDDQGVWSHYRSAKGWLDDTFRNIPIEELEYYINTDAGIGQETAIPVQPTSNLDSTVTLQTAALPVGSYLLGMRAKNEEGRWSHNIQRAFDVCTMYGPKASFTWAVNRNQVFFTNTSEYQMRAAWDFGDGSSDTLSINPAHTYVPGIYDVQLIAKNPCGADTLHQEVVVRGIARMMPSVHANEGVVLADLFGAALDSQSTIRMVRSGSPDIVATSYAYIDGTHLRPVFKFRGNPVGNYHLVVTGSGGRSDTLFDAITLEQSVGPDLWLEIAAPSAILVNRKVTTTVFVGNNGNVGAYGVPLYIKAPKSSKLTNISGKHQDSLPQEVYDSMPHFSAFIDSFNNDTTMFGAFYIPWIRPGEVQSYTFAYQPTVLGQSEVVYYLSEPMMDQALLDSTFRSNCSGLPKCMQCALDILSIVPVLGCGIGVFDVGCAIGETAAGGPGGGAVNLATSIAGAFLSCTTAPVGLALELGKLAAGAASATSGASSSCGPGGCNPKPKKPKPHHVVASFDPNIKVGPIGYSTDNYILGTDPMVYAIYFENADTASAPASEVLLLDTLDKQTLDLSTLQFLQFGFGDTVVSVIDQQGSSFVAEVDLRPAQPVVVRVQGDLDTATGVLQVYYVTLEPDTLKLVENPFDGFLPPNVNAPEGEGFVQFLVNPLPTLQHLDRIENDAAIYFDANKPIFTPMWLNTLDQEPPVSEVDDLPAQTVTTQFKVSWQGTDDHAGIMDYDVYVIINDTFSYIWKKGVSYTEATFNGAIGQQYKFYSVAYDNVGNIEAPPFDPVITPDAETTVVPTGVFAHENVAISVYPNPAQHVIYVAAGMLHTDQVQISLQNAAGILLDRWTVNDVQGQLQLQIPMAVYASGLYFVAIQWGGQVHTYPVVVQR